MRAAVDQARCQGHGRCYTTFPDLFEEDEYGHAVAAPTDAEPTRSGDLYLAAANCPEAAITVEPTS
jgi:ferredoxin